MSSPVITWSNLAPPFWMDAKFTPSAAANVTGSVVPTAKVLQGGTVGTAYSETIGAQGGTAPYTFAVTAGSLPAGLALSSAGVISGTPTAVATSDFTIQATDSNGLVGSTAFEISVASSGGGGSAANYCIVN